MILGITGTDGAGKGTVVDYLVKEKDLRIIPHEISLWRKLNAKGLPVTRNQMRLTGNELRALHGDDAVIKQAYLNAQQENKENVVIESLRATAEAVYLKGHGGILLGVDADPRIRYERVQQRRSASDKVSFEEFLAHEELERNDPDPHGMQKAAVIEMSDFIIKNASTIEELHAQIEEFLAHYEK